jgi:hypothetical protein
MAASPVSLNITFQTLQHLLIGPSGLRICPISHESGPGSVELFELNDNREQ